jgi:hypothetical protein
MDRAIQPVLDTAIFTGTGVKSTEANGMEDRISQDTDHFTTEYFGSDSSSYLWRQQNQYAPYGNQRRIVTVVVNTGYANQGGTLYQPNQQLIAVGYAQFFLYSLTYDPGGNPTYCGEYIGNNPCEGCKGKTARPGDGSATYVLRLVQ